MTKSAKLVIGIIVLAVVVIGGYLLWQNQKPKEQISKEPIKIGALLILSGDFAKYGERSKHAIEVAVEAFNQNLENKNKVEVLYEDTQADAKTAVLAYEKLKNIDKVRAIIGPLLQVEAAAITPLIVKDKVPVFSVAPVPIQNRSTVINPLVVWPDPTLESEQMAEYVFTQGVKNIAVMGTQDSWENEVSDAFSRKFESLGGKVIDKEIVLQDSKDTRLSITRVLAKNPEAVFLGTYYKFYFFLKTLKEMGYKGKLYSIEIDTYLADQTKTFHNGLQFISPDFYTPDFTQKFEEKYKEKPSLPAGQTYDATSILLSILKRTTNPEEILSEMANLKKWDGVSGEINFTDTHRAIFPLSIFELRNGEINRIK